MRLSCLVGYAEPTKAANEVNRGREELSCSPATGILSPAAVSRGWRRSRVATSRDQHHVKPYGSALDLPSVAEMLREIQGYKLITRVVGRKHRAELIELERKLRELAGLVDRFYELLGPRNWIFHDRLSTTAVADLVDLPAEKAEAALIDLYREPDTLRFAIPPLRRFPELAVRMPLIERAQRDYVEGRYHATVLTLLSVMDGFVNDVERDDRRGLHARSVDEMTAWDSVVGHHMGLARAHDTFIKGFRKTSDDEVFELYRNGIVHGMLINYDNVVVATKAWNRLFAVADWADSRRKQADPIQKAPSWRELFRQITANAQAKKALQEWKPSSLSAGEQGFDEDSVVVAAKDFLEAWRRKNYGRMAELISPLVARSTVSRAAGDVHEEYEQHQLRAFRVLSVDHQAAAVAIVSIELSVQGALSQGRMRWIRQDAAGHPVTPNQQGAWRLMSWGYYAIINGLPAG